jgi:ubiquinone/menaquinone biosynthesis C-methylase UbiE
MGWLDLPRVPEPEVMDDCGEVEAYASAAEQSFLSAIDDTFIAHARRLAGARASAGSPGRALDIGTGPGQIVLKLARHLPGWQLLGVDRSPSMIRQALAARELALRGASHAPGELTTRVEFLLADGNRLPFADASFDLVLSNSVLHHLERPAGVFEEIARVVKRDGAILLRDLRRPSRLGYTLHVRWHGRRYSGTMHKLYCDSVRAAYTQEELFAMLQASPLRGARVFARGRTHLGVERAAGLDAG